MSYMSRASSSLGNSGTNAPSPSSSKPYKVVLEAVTREKKNLHSDISYDINPPQGYTFVPAGNPDLTEFCKELSRKRGLKVHVVSVAPKNKAYKNPENLSHHIHRIGHHFDNDVVDRACEWLGIRGNGFSSSNSNDIVSSNFPARHVDTENERFRLPQEELTQEQRIQQVRKTIRDLFPKIPAGDMEEIIKRAFEEGSARVGNAGELSLPRRVQLATVAHIRHMYTNYESRLKSGGYLNARAKVESECLDQLVKWRGEAENDKTELEEIFREVIVLDDDSDVEDRSGPEPATSVETIRRPRSTGVSNDLPEDSRHGIPQLTTVRVAPRAKRLETATQAFLQRYDEARARQHLPVGRDSTQYRKRPLSTDAYAGVPRQSARISPPLASSSHESVQPIISQRDNEVILLPTVGRHIHQSRYVRPTALYVPPTAEEDLFLAQSSRPIRVSDQYPTPVLHPNQSRPYISTSYPQHRPRANPSTPHVIYESVERSNGYRANRNPFPFDTYTAREVKRPRIEYDNAHASHHHRQQPSGPHPTSMHRDDRPQQPEFIDLTDHSPPQTSYSNLPGALQRVQLQPNKQPAPASPHRHTLYARNQPTSGERSRSDDQSVPVPNSVPVHVPPQYPSQLEQRVTRYKQGTRRTEQYTPSYLREGRRAFDVDQR